MKVQNRHFLSNAVQSCNTVSSAPTFQHLVFNICHEFMLHCSLRLQCYSDLLLYFTRGINLCFSILNEVNGCAINFGIFVNLLVL